LFKATKSANAKIAFSHRYLFRSPWFM